MAERMNNWTKSTLFLLPMIEDILGPYYKSYGFLNMYLSDHQYETVHENCLYVLYKPRFTQAYIAYETKLEEHSLCIDVYDVGDKRGQVMFVFKVPNEWKEDYFTFKSGKYSKFSKAYKTKFKKGSNIHKVVFKDYSLKKYWEKLLNTKLPDTNEVWDLPYPKDEIYRYDREVHRVLRKQK